MEDDAERPPEPDEPVPGRRGLGLALIAAGAAGGLWLALHPLDGLLPAPPEPHERPAATAPRDPARTAPPPGPGSPERSLLPPDAGRADAPDATSAEAGRAGPPPGPAGAEPEPTEPLAGAPEEPAAAWTEAHPETHPETEAAPAAAHEELRARLVRQLAMNDLGGVRVEIVGERIVTSGPLAHPDDRQRVALLVRALAPGFAHEDHTFVSR